MSRFVIEGCGLLSMYILNQNKLFITDQFSAANETSSIRRHTTIFYKTTRKSKTNAMHLQHRVHISCRSQNET